MQVIPKLVDTVGQVQQKVANNDKRECHIKPVDWTDFKVTAQYIGDNSAPDAQKPYVTYRACVSDCNGNKCPDDLPKCDDIKQ